MAALTKAIGRSYVAASTYGSTIYTPTMIKKVDKCHGRGKTNSDGVTSQLNIISNLWP